MRRPPAGGPQRLPRGLLVPVPRRESARAHGRWRSPAANRPLQRCPGRRVSPGWRDANIGVCTHSASRSPRHVALPATLVQRVSRPPRIGRRPVGEQVALALLGHARERKLMRVDVSADTVTDKLAQPYCWDRVELHRGVAAEFLRPGVCLLGRARRQIPLLDLLSRYSWTFKMNLGAWRISTELCFNITGSIPT